MSAQALQSFFALALGYATAGVIATGYQLATKTPPGFHLLERGPRPSTFAFVPVLAFAAPFIIMRATLQAPREPYRFQAVMIATVVAGIWSLMSGTVIEMAIEALRLVLD